MKAFISKNILCGLLFISVSAFAQNHYVDVANGVFVGKDFSEYKNLVKSDIADAPANQYTNGDNYYYAFNSVNKAFTLTILGDATPAGKLAEVEYGAFFKLYSTLLMNLGVADKTENKDGTTILTWNGQHGLIEVRIPDFTKRATVMFYDFDLAKK